MRRDLIIAGVGGQGTLLASKIISQAAQNRGLFVRTSETIGMAQRGGSVASHVRIDAREVSPVVPPRGAGILLGFELAEAARMVPRLARDAEGVVNTDVIIPANVSLGKGVYLEREYLSLLRAALPLGVFISAAPLAQEAGDARTLNIVMLGASSGAGILPFARNELMRAMERCIRPKLLAMNVKAFALGAAAAQK